MQVAASGGFPSWGRIAYSIGRAQCMRGSRVGNECATEPRCSGVSLPVLLVCGGFVLIPSIARAMWWYPGCCSRVWGTDVCKAGSGARQVAAGGFLRERNGRQERNFGRVRVPVTGEWSRQEAQQLVVVVMCANVAPGQICCVCRFVVRRRRSVFVLRSVNSQIGVRQLLQGRQWRYYVRCVGVRG